MATGTSGNRLRRLAIPTLVVALITGTTGVAGTASAAPAGSSGNGSGTGYFTAGSDRKVTLTDGADRRPGGNRAATPKAAVDETGSGMYVVELAEDPLTTYTGGVSGLARTRPAAGNRLDVTSTPSQAYRRHLDTQRGSVAAAAGVTVNAVYTTAFNGFSAKLTSQQVSTLRADKRVRAVTASRALGTPSAPPRATTAAPATPTAANPT
ncbi:protease inhibitor I9 family protein, partial [Micromonospora foliorum]|uniref:protease inhibitor I9 family protein n=1 Tax=Micromonospora foliorum TaxID=2911210 RepID=UPI001EE90341